MPDPEEPSGFLLSDSKKNLAIVRTGAHHERACPWQLVDSSIPFLRGGFRRNFLGMFSRPKTGLPSSVPWNWSAICPAAGDAHFFLQSISPNEKWCNLALNIFFQTWKILKDVERKQSCIRIQIALPKEKPFYCGNSYNYAFRYVFQSPCKTLWQIFSAETTGWERTHNSRGSQREVRFAEFLLSSEGKNDDLVSLQEL